MKLVEEELAQNQNDRNTKISIAFDDEEVNIDDI